MYLSSWLNEIVELPVDPNDYFEKLQEKISTSSFEKALFSNFVAFGELKRGLTLLSC